MQMSCMQTIRALTVFEEISAGTWSRFDEQPAAEILEELHSGSGSLTSDEAVLGDRSRVDAELVSSESSREAETGPIDGVVNPKLN